MKRTSLISAALVLALLLALALPSVAEGVLTLTEERLLAWKDYDESFRGAYFAIAENTGDEALMLQEGSLKLLDAEGAELYESSYLEVYPRVLQPGEKGVISSYGKVSDGEVPARVATTSLNYTLMDPYVDIKFYPASAGLELIDDDYRPAARLTIEVENNTDEPLFDLEISCILRDDEGGLLATMTTWTYRVGVPAGGKMLVREDLGEELVNDLKEKGLTTAQVEVMAYTSEYKW